MSTARLDPDPRCALQGSPGFIDVLRLGTGQTRDDGALDFMGDPFDRLEIARGAEGEPGLDDVHIQPGELLRDHQLFFHIHARAGGLLSVPKGGVEYLNHAVHVGLLKVPNQRNKKAFIPSTVSDRVDPGATQGRRQAPWYHPDSEKRGPDRTRPAFPFIQSLTRTLRQMLLKGILDPSVRNRIACSRLRLRGEFGLSAYYSSSQPLDNIMPRGLSSCQASCLGPTGEE